MSEKKLFLIFLAVIMGGGCSAMDETNFIKARPVVLRATAKFEGTAAHKPETGQFRVIRLRIKGIQPPAKFASVEGIRIFINKPEASSETPTDDPHYAGTFVFNLSRSQDVIINIAPAVNAIRHSKEVFNIVNPIHVTLVAVSRAPDKLPEDLKIPFQSLSVEVPEEVDR